MGVVEQDGGCPQPSLCVVFVDINECIYSINFVHIVTIKHCISDYLTIEVINWV